MATITMASRLHLYLALVSFATWAVYTGGLAAMQAGCGLHVDGLPIPGLTTTAGLTCATAYGYWWFVASFEFLAVAALVITYTLGYLKTFKTTFVGVYAISTLLFVEAAQIFLVAESKAFYSSRVVHTELQIVSGGAIMTAAVNLFIVVVLGAETLTDPPEPCPTHKSAHPDTAYPTKMAADQEMDSPV